MYIRFYFFAFLCVFIAFESNALQENTITFEATLAEGEQFLLLPVPNHVMTSNSKISLKENNSVLSAKYSVENYWPSLSEGKFIRVLLITLDSSLSKKVSLTISWSVADKELPVNYSSVFPMGILVYPSINWLEQSLLLHPKSEGLNKKWYLEPQKKHAHYVTNKELLAQNGYLPDAAGQWLYDRPQAIYQLFIMSGEKEWLYKAHELSDFYMKHIDEKGQFTLTKRFDPKYIMPKGLFYRYLLTGDKLAKQTLARLYESSLNWDESYNINRGFWTERNQAAALNAAITYWEVSGSKEALDRANLIIDATVKMTFEPDNNWSLRGCPQHSYNSHEGNGDYSPACSPWMMALLGDALWRFYLLTGDIKSASLIDAFGDFILNYGLFYGDKRVGNIVIPKYIVSIENPEQEELNQWTSPQHACDVAGLIGKSVFLKDIAGTDSFVHKMLFTSLLEQCQASYTQLKKLNRENKSKLYWVLKPVRRFSWVYSTTSDLPWLNDLFSN